MLHDLVEQYGPALIFANVLAGSLGLPVPAMPSLVLFGAMAAMHPGSVGTQLLPVLILSIFATLIGDSAWYLAGRIYGGNTLKTICRLSLSRDTCVKKTERFFGRWGVRVLAVAKFVPGLSIVSIPMAGAMGTKYRTFLTYDSIGAALWSGTGLIIGALFAKQIDMLFAIAGRLGRTAAFVAVALLLLYAAYRWVRRRQDGAASCPYNGSINNGTRTNRCALPGPPGQWPCSPNTTMQQRANFARYASNRQKTAKAFFWSRSMSASRASIAKCATKSRPPS